MIALLLAAQVAVLPAPEKSIRNLVLGKPVSVGALYAGCGNAKPIPTDSETAAGARKLGDLPKARMELAVQRSVDGCVVPVYTNYDPEQRPATSGATRAGALVNRR